VSACGSSSAGALFSDTGHDVCNAANGCASSSIGGAVGNQGAGGAPNVGGDVGVGEASGGDVGAGGSDGAGGDVGAGGTDIGGAGGDVGAGGADAGLRAGGANSGDRGGAGGTPTATCPTGDYHAVLTGPYRSTAGTKDIGATIDFSVSDTGAAKGTFAGPGGAKAAVAGSVDCSTGMLNASIDNGVYLIALATVRFSGTFDGTYDSRGGTFDGTWTVMESGAAGNGGTGTWSTSGSH
jgi:hypothetical protein